MTETQSTEDTKNSEEKNPPVTPEEARYISAASPFVSAIASQKYSEAYAQLSKHALNRMSLNQFSPADDDTVFEQNEKNPFPDVTEQKFTELMQQAEVRYGKPKTLKDLHVHSTEQGVLTRKKTEDLGALDSMLAIGAMPDSIPFEIRRCSLRGQIKTELSTDQISEAAKAMGMTAEDLQKDENFDPYMTIKIVLIEEDGSLKVGYFEFLPPSMMD